MVIPYLAFSGNCEDAFRAYARAFGGRILYLSRYTKETGDEELCGKVMHLEAEIGGARMSGADAKHAGAPSDRVKLMVHMDSRAQAENACDILADGGQLLQRLTPHPPPDDGGMGALVLDAYGYTWILTAPNDHKPSA